MDEKVQEIASRIGEDRASARRVEKSTFARDWRSWLFVILTATVVSMLMKQRPPVDAHDIAFFPSLLSSLIYSACIGSLMLYTASQSWAYISRRPFPINWILLIGSILVPATIGTLVCGWIVVLIGHHTPAEYFDITRRSIQFSLMLSLVFGISFYLYENVKRQLDATTLQLHARQLAEERARKAAIAAQLSSLESRIRPHFLFNTLNSISSLIREQPERAERMVEQLAALLRYSLDMDEKRTVPLRQELKLVNDYLAIEQARFGSRLRFSVDVPEELNAVGVPPFVLQTLVENSIKHAVARHRSGGTISVTASTEGDTLVLTVRDDGPGFSPDDIRAGHGLDILQARLRSLYSERGKLDLNAVSGAATVSISLPRF